MSTELRNQSDAVRALWLAQLTGRTGRVVALTRNDFKASAC